MEKLLSLALLLDMSRNYCIRIRSICSETIEFLGWGSWAWLYFRAGVFNLFLFSLVLLALCSSILIKPIEYVSLDGGLAKDSLPPNPTLSSCCTCDAFRLLSRPENTTDEKLSWLFLWLFYVVFRFVCLRLLRIAFMSLRILFLLWSRAWIDCTFYALGWLTLVTIYDDSDS